MLRFCFFLALLVPLAACDSGGDYVPSTGSPEPQKDRPAPSASWDGTTLKVKSPHLNDQSTYFQISRGDKGSDPFVMKATFHGLKQGTKVTVADKTGEVDAQGTFEAKVDLKGKVGKLPIKHLTDYKVATGFDVPVTIAIPHFGKLETKTPSDDGFAFTIDAALKNAVGKPLVFPGEPKSEAKADVAFLATGAIGELFGEPKVVSDIDWVVMLEDGKEGPTKTCGGYENSGDLEVMFVDSTATIYDRRTGKVVEKKIFKPRQACPQFVVTKKGSDKATETPSRTDVKKWLEQRLRQG